MVISEQDAALWLEQKAWQRYWQSLTGSSPAPSEKPPAPGPTK